MKQEDPENRGGSYGELPAFFDSGEVVDWTPNPKPRVLVDFREACALCAFDWLAHSRNSNSLKSSDG